MGKEGGGMNLPNKITLSRIFLVPVFMAFLIKIPQWVLDWTYQTESLRIIHASLHTYNLFMSRLSFKTFCIELFAERKSITGSEAFALFNKKGILNMLDEDYDILHGHGFDYVLYDIEKIIGET